MDDVPDGKSRGLRPDVLDVGGPRGSWCPGLPIGQDWASKKPGAHLAHGSWFVRKAVLPPAV